MIGLPNPWLVGGVLLALGAAGIGGYVRGEAAGRNEVQVAWDRDNAKRALLASENEQRSRDTQEKLQASADADRTRNAKTLADMDARLAAAVGELRKRPARPALAPGADPQAAGAGPQGCTGLGLYGPDAVFLAGEADTGARVKLQRDQCYAAYERADSALRSLSRQYAEPATAGAAPAP